MALHSIIGCHDLARLLHVGKGGVLHGNFELLCRVVAQERFVLAASHKANPGQIRKPAGYPWEEKAQLDEGRDRDEDG